jgi:hypothetical protein
MFKVPVCPAVPTEFVYDIVVLVIAAEFVVAADA